MIKSNHFHIYFQASQLENKLPVIASLQQTKQNKHEIQPQCQALK